MEIKLKKGIGTLTKAYSILRAAGVDMQGMLIEGAGATHIPAQMLMDAAFGEGVVIDLCAAVASAPEVTEETEPKVAVEVLTAFFGYARASLSESLASVELKKTMADSPKG